MKLWLGAAAIALAFPAPPAQAEPAPAQAGPLFAAGYKVGNGLGFAGVDFLVLPFERWGLDLQIARSAFGVDVAPAVQYQLDPASGTYLGLGYSRTALEIFGQGRTRHGAFANVGRQWLLLPKLGLVAGVGYHLGFGSREEVFGQLVETPAAGSLNFELGLRYYFP